MKNLRILSKSSKENANITFKLFNSFLKKGFINFENIDYMNVYITYTISLKIVYRILYLIKNPY